MSDFPAGRPAALELFRPPDAPQSFSAARLALVSDRIARGDPTICRWCLQPFDPALAQPRSIWERGQLRAHLKMADNGSELAICDTCWPAAFGYATFLHGQAVPNGSPEWIPNPLLRALTNGQD